MTHRAAHRQAAVRRSNVRLAALYRAKSEKPHGMAQVAAKSPCRHAKGVPIIDGAFRALIPRKGTAP
jgi:hypothetical protein